jgi:hypothetical protein
MLSPYGRLTTVFNSIRLPKQGLKGSSYSSYPLILWPCISTTCFAPSTYIKLSTTAASWTSPGIGKWSRRAQYLPHQQSQATLTNRHFVPNPTSWILLLLLLVKDNWLQQVPSYSYDMILQVGTRSKGAKQAFSAYGLPTYFAMPWALSSM